MKRTDYSREFISTFSLMKNYSYEIKHDMLLE